jgi:hypothetical protein
MNPFRASHKTQGISTQNPWLMKQTDWVCLQNICDYSPFGVSLDGRTFEGDFYRYGFQKQEKDDEIVGEGKNYTADFWQFDTRLARRWNCDPVIKPHRSPYDVLSNNPIIMIDPYGEDDYYNSNGSYNKGMSKKHNKDGHNIYILSTDGKSKTLLSDLPIKTENNIKVVERVMSGYAKKAGVSGSVNLKYSNSIGDSKILAFTTDNNVFVNSEGGVDDLLSNYHNLESVMFHEKQHQDAQKDGKHLSDQTFEGILNHIDIYTKQIQDQSFERTSKDFKSGQIETFGSYLEIGLNKAIKGFEEAGDTEKVKSKINSFNNGIGKKYGYSISANQTSVGGELKWFVDVKKTKK